jgi:hypothetical protein
MRKFANSRWQFSQKGIRAFHASIKDLAYYRLLLLLLCFAMSAVSRRREQSSRSN